jgi:hypothetical protein
MEEQMDRLYAELTKQLLEYIMEIRSETPDTPLVEIITDYCFKNDIEPEMAGDAISQDFYFKQFIETDCKAFSEFNNKPLATVKLEEW